MSVVLYTLISVLVISLLAFIGIVSLTVNAKRLKTVLVYLISFSAGALFGDAFIHLLPEVVESYGFSLIVSLGVLGGILIFFVLEKIIHWQHCHLPITEEHIHPFAYMNIIGDALHNFIAALTAVLGAVLALWATTVVEQIEMFLVPIAVGGFIYIAGSDLIPELHKETRLRRSIMQIIAFLLGIGVMSILLLLE